MSIPIRFTCCECLVRATGPCTTNSFKAPLLGQPCISCFTSSLNNHLLINERSRLEWWTVNGHSPMYKPHEPVLQVLVGFKLSVANCWMHKMYTSSWTTSAWICLGLGALGPTILDNCQWFWTLSKEKRTRLKCLLNGCDAFSRFSTCVLLCR